MGLYLTLMTPRVQTKLIAYFTRQLHERTGLELSIGRVDFRFLETVVLEEVLLRDERQDTLLFVGRLFARLDSFRLMHRSCTVKELRLDNAYLNYRAPDKGRREASALDRLMDAFSRRDTLAAAHPGWKVNLSRVELRDCRVNYAEATIRPAEQGINWTDVECREVNAVLRSIDFPAGRFRARVEGLSLKEKSGFALRELTANVLLEDARLLVTDGTIRAGKSRLHLDTLVHEWVPGAGYWQDFVRKMPQRYVFSDAAVYLDDLAYFNGTLLGMDNLITGSGEIYGTVVALAGKNLDVCLGEKSRVRASFRSRGLPRVADTRFEIMLQESSLVAGELREIYLPWLEEHYLPLPGFLDRYDTFIIFGYFSGTLDDFALAARSATPGAGGTIYMTYQADTAGYRYAGDLRLNRVDYALLSGQDALGAGAFNGKFSGGKARESTFTLEGEAPRVALFNTRLRRVQVAARGEGDRYDVSLSVDNDSIRARVNMEYESRDSMTAIRGRGELHLDTWDAWAPALFARGESVDARFDGEWTEGRDTCHAALLVASLDYSSERGKVAIDTIRFTHDAGRDDGKTTLASDLIDAELTGNYRQLQPETLWKYLLSTYFPSIEKDKQPPLREFDFACSVTMKRLNDLLPLVLPGLSLADEATLAARHDKAGNIHLEFTADSVGWEKFHLAGPRLRVDGDRDSVESTCTAEQLHYEPVGRIYNLREVTRVRPDRVASELTWNNWGRETYSGALSLDLGLSRYGDRHVTQLLVHPGVIIIGDTVWKVERSLVLKERDNYFINNFEIRHDDQLFRLKGRVGESPRDTLLVQCENLEIADLNRVLLGNRVPLTGILNGHVRVQDFYRDRLVHANVELSRWGIAGDTLGTLNAHSYWDARQKRLRLDIANHVNDRVPVSANGYYNPSTNDLYLQCILSSLDARQVTSYIPGVEETGSGSISGIVTLQGPSHAPLLDGYLQFDRVTVPVEPLHTTFTINDRVEIKENRVLFDRLKLQDDNSNAVGMSGYYDIVKGHHDVNLLFKDFLILNAPTTWQEAVHGQVAISGRARMHDPAGVPTVVANLKTGRGSRLFVPLESTGLEDEYNFLHFINASRGDARAPAPGRRRQTLSPAASLDLNVAIEITNDLELQLILDPTVGDILKSIGHGNLRLSLEKDKQMNLFGEYVIEQGEYLFTMGNLVNKQFILHSGGHIEWNGSLTNATIDVTALYPLRTALGDLVQNAVSDWDTRDYSTKVPVECTLHLTENLMNPTINFGIEFPSLDTRTRSTLQSLLDSPDEINKQVFALLLMNRFYPRDAEEIMIRDAGYQTGVATASEMLSRQFSRWLSRLTSNLDIGVAYRPGDRETNNEFEIALSTRVWNNRISISANGNVIDGTKGSGQTPVTGDFDVDVKLNPPGTLKLKAYSHTDNKITYNATETVQGIGVSYQEYFDTFRELLRNYLGLFKNKKPREK
jgi:hypothetical protein